MANRNRASNMRGSRRVERQPSVRKATGVAVAECEDCGSGVIVFVDKGMKVFAEAHFPGEHPDEWLTKDFIPALLMAAYNRHVVEEQSIEAEYNKSLLRGVPLDIEWGENDIRNVILDARYTGVGDTPKIIEDDAWIEANTKLMAEIGPDVYFRRFLAVMRRPPILPKLVD